MTKQIISGALIGVLAPILGIIIILTFMSPHVTVDQMINQFWMNSSLSPAISLALLVNLALFFILDKFNKEMMSRGIIAGTLIWGFYIVALLMQN